MEREGIRAPAGEKGFEILEGGYFIDSESDTIGRILSNSEKELIVVSPSDEKGYYRALVDVQKIRE